MSGVLTREEKTAFLILGAPLIAVGLLGGIALGAWAFRAAARSLQGGNRPMRVITNIPVVPYQPR